MSDLAHPKLVAAIVAAIIAVVAIWISVSVSRWRRVTWREHMDTQIGALPKETGPKEGRDSGPWAIWKVLTHHEEVAEPSLVLVRVRNSGLLNISKGDVRRPLTFTFPGRAIKEFTVTDCRGVSRQEIQPAGDLNMPGAGENSISLPRFAMRRKAGFKLLVLLSGAGRDIVVEGRLRRGSVLHESRARGPLARNIAFGSVLLLLVGIQAGFTFGQASAAPSYCASGRLVLEGSTAFAPTAQEIGSAYTAACHGAAISVSAIATFNGLNAVADANATSEPSTDESGAGQSGAGQSGTGQANADGTGAGQPSSGGTATALAAGTEQIAMSDGPAPVGYPTLVGHPVAVMLFAVVVNKQLDIYNLTTTQLRDIWLGKITNWGQAGGPNLPVRIVARTTASGTRRAFDEKVLGGQAEPAFSSYNCVNKNAVPLSPVIRCEVSDTGTLLEKVDSIPGAIGYAQVSDAAPYLNVSAVKINGSDPAIGAVENRTYPYWTVEYLYTAGKAVPGSLAAEFLSYLDSTASDDTLRINDYTPCVDRGQSLMRTLCGP
jgi:phosphate transport system substrate-binding protein